jgi:tRNA (cytidine/uridine-2'-O-)-methyltransferase
LPWQAVFLCSLRKRSSVCLLFAKRSSVLSALRASAHRHCDHLHVFSVMFYSPRIAPNTGNAIRMVAATGCELHLVQPLGFELSEPKLRRAGLDYHDLASVTVHESLAAAWRVISPARVFAFTAHAQRSFADVSYRPGDVLMFGPEPTGLDAQTLADPHISDKVRIPMIAGRRSLNLSNAAAVAVYEAWRQQGFAGAA